MMRAVALASLLFALPIAAAAEGRELIGVGRIFTNDYFGDNRDRWRTGSYALSFVTGSGWVDARPLAPGQVLEYRLRSELIAPRRLSGPDSTDRPYAASLSAGLHTHWSRAGFDLSAGADALLTGPQTGLDGLHDWIHGALGAPDVSDEVRAAQIGNGTYLALSGEASRSYEITPNTMLRPYAEVMYGPEDIARVGADLVIGRAALDDLWLRDVTTGQLYAGVEGSDYGVMFIAGLDVAYVDDTIYLPEEDGFVPKDMRARARAGVHWQIAPDTSFFYGLTYLSEEFEGQPRGQYVGSLKLNFNF